MKKISIIILTVLLALAVFVSCDQSVGDLIGFTVSFDANGGTGLMDQVFVKGSSTTAPANGFQRTGYTFVSWNTIHDGSGTEYKVGDTINGYDVNSIRLYAQWVPNTYTITVGAQGNGTASALYNEYTVVDEDIYVKLTAEADEGYRFIEYSVTGGASVDVNNEYLMIPAGNASNVTVTAVFSANDYAVAFNANGGEGTMADQKFTFDEAKALSANTFTRTGYEFASWNVYEGGTGISFEDGQEVVNLASEKGETVVLFAQWTPITYTITVEEVEHGEVSVLYNQYHVDDDPVFIPLMEDPSLGYSLNGYSVIGGGFVSPDHKYLVIPAGNTGDIVVTPTFTPNIYYVEFDSNAVDATGEAELQWFYVNEEQALSANVFERVGYTFAGWNTVEDGRGFAYNDQQTVVNLSFDYEGVKLYAQWNPTPYTITFTSVEHGSASALYQEFTIKDDLVFIPLTATPEFGYELTGYIVAGTGAVAAYIDGEYLVIPAGATGDIEITPVFEENAYSITYEDCEHGMIYGTYMYTVKDDLFYIPLTVIPEIGYELTDVIVDGAFASLDGDYLIIPAGTDNDIVVSAVFEPIEYAITVALSDRGWAFAETTTYTVEDFEGTEPLAIELEVVPNAGCALYDWTIAGSMGAFIYDDDLYIMPGTIGDITITPHFLPVYNVTLVKNGGTVTEEADIEYYFFAEGATLPTAEQITRTGYTFGGWFTNDQYTGDAVTEIKDTDMGAKTFYAKWSVVTYTVKFNKNNSSATGTMSNESFNYDEEKKLAKNAFALTGYTFGTWNTVATPTTEVPGTSYTDEQQVKNMRETAGDVNLYAQWVANTYKVKFNKNATSATGTMADESFTYDVKQNLTTNAYTRTGYIFTGWNTVATPTQQQPGTSYSDGQEVENLTTTAGDEITLYAQWTAINYSVKFNKNSESATGTMSDESFTYDVSKALTQNAFAKTGYTFTGWNTVATPTQEEPGTPYADKAEVKNLTSTKDDVVNLYAQWEANTYTVKFDKNAEAATGTMNDQSFTYDVEGTLTSLKFKNIGYDFTGWNTKADGTGTPYANKAQVINLTSAAGGEVTLYAQWSLATYAVSVTTESEGYTVQADKDSYQYTTDAAGTVINLTITGPIPTIKDYDLSAPTTASIVVDQENSKITITSGSYGGPISIKCIFVTDYKTVTFKANGGEGEDYAQNVPTNEETALKANTFTYDGKYFIGWAETAEGEVVYDDRDLINIDEDLTLYAVWED